ncbi:SRPBCC family protein [Mycobacterium sp. PS03-16]|uniref:SRPBCC family protein n=1 Tax=Mycobacterium sp. PS03-16 TaxID=2559611 RepID=UPI0010745067|nr:SRPBCC family protein [Mycobacterium sp. PS03-16]TFV55457.1 SRPBCC family protein [Mycobacterium sp. PS03-16]
MEAQSPTARLVATPAGYDLTFTRTFHACPDDVWASVTDPERTAQWFGTWRGEGAIGATIEVQMAFEEGTPWCEMRIDACDPPRHLALTMTDDMGEWRLALVVEPSGDATELRLTQRLTDLDGVGEVGPGWEYYLDNLVAARDQAPLPDFGDYFPSMKPYFEALTPSGRL